MYLIDIDLFVLYFSKVDQFNFLSDHIFKTACVVNFVFKQFVFYIWGFALEPYSWIIFNPKCKL